jgi:hypothetical protein
VISLKAPILTVASSTTVPAASSDEVTRMPTGVAPAVTVGSLGGARMIFTVPDASGKSERVGGAKVTQGAADPSASKEKRSTTVPVLRTCMANVVLRPGSTSTVGCDS